MISSPPKLSITYKHIYVNLLIGLAFLYQWGFCDESRRGAFLTEGPGSAGVALGSALIGKGSDLSAGFYNPATLVEQPSGALFEYSQPNSESSRSWLAFAIGTKRMKNALLWKSESLPLSSSKNAFLMSTGISDKLVPFVPRGFSLGLTLGYIQEKIAMFSASSFLASVGVSFAGTTNKFGYGVGGTLKNVYFSGLKFREDGETEVWPIEPEIGAYVSRWGVTFLGSAKKQEKIAVGLGLAYRPMPFFEVRAGFNGNPRLGTGFELKKFKLDYAMTLGELKNANSLSLSYLWGKEEAEKDYTDPLNSLEAQYGTLKESILSEVRLSVQNGELPELSKVLKLLVVDLKSDDGWSFYTALKGEKRLKVRLPLFKKARREYFFFAVAYANDAANAKELGEEFVKKHSRASVSKLVRVVLSADRKLSWP